MGDTPKLPSGDYNKLIRSWVNGETLEAEKPKEEDSTPFCYHNFTHYQGLIAVDEFCLLCGVKRQIPNEVPSTDWNFDDNGST